MVLMLFVHVRVVLMLQVLLMLVLMSCVHRVEFVLVHAVRVMRHGRHFGTGAAVRVRVVRVLVPVERVVQGCVQRMHHGQHGTQRDRHGVRNAVVQMRRQAQAESHRHGRQGEVGLHRVLVRRGQRVLRVSVAVAVSVRVVAVVRRRMHEVMLWVAQRRAERRGQQR